VATHDGGFARAAGDVALEMAGGSVRPAAPAREPAGAAP
jgi:hypothetical protein